ncbi:putative conjugative transfer protein TraI [Orientia tsutsugamushi str. Sido]|nr:putative conjugative transfer protein TraI [Orientia tsutsugamushi str. Sido]
MSNISQRYQRQPKTDDSQQYTQQPEVLKSQKFKTCMNYQVRYMVMIQIRITCRSSKQVS